MWGSFDPRKVNGVPPFFLPFFKRCSGVFIGRKESERHPSPFLEGSYSGVIGCVHATPFAKFAPIKKQRRISFFFLFLFWKLKWGNAESLRHLSSLLTSPSPIAPRQISAGHGKSVLFFSLSLFRTQRKSKKQKEKECKSPPHPIQNKSKQKKKKRVIPRASWKLFYRLDYRILFIVGYRILDYISLWICWKLQGFTLAIYMIFLKIYF